MWIDSIPALESAVGKFPPGAELKVIDHIDPLAARWIASSPCLFATFAGADRVPAITIAGGAPGFLGVERDMLRITRDSIDHHMAARAGDSFGSLILIPGIGETVRVNGRVASVDDEGVAITVEECYAHCAKALIRSDFWKAEPVDHHAVPDAVTERGAFLSAGRFLAWATVDDAGRADVSPKGDPPGELIREHDGALWFAERPGNRRTDSQRNIIGQPHVAGLLLTPGSATVYRFTADARATDDATIRGLFAIRDKLPTLATRFDEREAALYGSEALRRAQLWPVRPAEGLDGANLFVEHVRLNRTKGIAARLASAAISIPGLMRKGLEKDYEKNLY